MSAPRRRAPADPAAVKPVYLLVGEESFLAQETLRSIEERSGASALNKETFTIPEAKLDDVFLALQTGPFLGGTRLIVLRDAQRLKTAEVQEAAEFLRHPSPSSCLAIVWSERMSKDARKKVDPLWVLCAEVGEVIECRPLYDNKVPGWVRERFARAGRSIDENAVQALVRETGSSLQDVTNEIEKLLLYTAGRATVTVDDVLAVSGRTRLANLNQLAEAVERKDLAGAVWICERLLAEGEAPLRMTATVHRTVRRLLQAKSMLEEEDRSPQDVRTALRLHAYFDRDFFGRLSVLRQEELEGAVAKIVQADIELKSSNRPESMVLSEMLLRLFDRGYKA